MKKICVITTTRADYGLFYPLIKALKNFNLQILATGTHFSAAFGNSYKEIEKDGFKIDFKAPLDIDSSSEQSVAASISLYANIFLQGFKKLKPDIILLLGDRYEILTAAQIAVLLNIKIAHLYGGDITSGANDNLFRNAISQMADIHFASNRISQKNLIKMNLPKSKVYNTGSLGIENIILTERLSATNFFKKINFSACSKNFLVTFHPITHSKYGPSLTQLNELLSALKNFPDVGVIFTFSNSDAEGDIINKRIIDYCHSQQNSKFYETLGRENYINAIRNVDVVIGNSSSLFYEVPFLLKPSINIGDRQKGRYLLDSIINASPNSQDIQNAILKALHLNINLVEENFYGCGTTSRKIVKILKKL